MKIQLLARLKRGGVSEGLQSRKGFESNRGSIESKYTIMNTSKHKACFGSFKYSQVLESLSLRGGVRWKANAPYRIYVIPLRDPALPSSLSTLQHPLSFPFVTLFHITAKTQRPGNYHQLILSPPNFRYTLASVQLFLLGECSPEKIISGQFFWMLESIPCCAVRKHCPLKCLTLIFS